MDTCKTQMKGRTVKINGGCDILIHSLWSGSVFKNNRSHFSHPSLQCRIFINKMFNYLITHIQIQIHICQILWQPDTARSRRGEMMKSIQMLWSSDKRWKCVRYSPNTRTQSVCLLTQLQLETNTSIWVYMRICCAMCHGHVCVCADAFAHSRTYTTVNKMASFIFNAGGLAAATAIQPQSQ